jgi:hypothetical protein
MQLTRIEDGLNSWMIRPLLSDRQIIVRINVQDIDEIQILGAIHNDDVKVLIASFCTVNQ